MTTQELKDKIRPMDFPLIGKACGFHYNSVRNWWEGKHIKAATAARIEVAARAFIEEQESIIKAAAKKAAKEKAHQNQI